MATATKTKALRIATRCVTIEQFIATFHRFCDESSFFISTLGTRPVGLETAFSIQLEGGKPVLQGLGVVLDAWPTAANPFNRPGVRLGLKRLTNDSVPIFKQLIAARAMAASDPRTTQPLPNVNPNATPPPAAKPEPVPQLTGLPAINTAPMALPARPPQEVPIPPTSVEPAKPEPAPLLREPPPRRLPTPLPIKRSGLEPVKPMAPPQRANRDRPRIETPPLGSHKPVIIAPRARTEEAKLESAESTNVDVTPLPPPPVATPPPSLAISLAPLLPMPSAPVAKAEPEIAPPVLPPIVIVDAPRRLDATPIPAPVEDTLPTAIDPSNQVRTPGSELVLPANPLMNLSDESLTGFVDCTVYEETGNFFDVEPGSDVDIGDVIAPPLPRTRTSPIVAEIAEPLDLEPPGGRSAEPIVERARPTTPPQLVDQTSIVVDGLPSAAFDTPPARGAEAAKVTEHITIPRRGNPWLLIATLLLALGAGAVVFVMLTNRGGDDERNLASATPPPPPPPIADAARAADPIDAAPVIATAADAAVVAADAAEPASDEGPPGPIQTPVVGAGPCKLTVNTTPAGSMVMINGETAGPSPITVSGPCEQRQIEITHPRYQSVTRTVTLTPDKPEVIDATLVRPTHTVMVITTPPGAEIAIDGRHAGTSPTAIKVLGFTSVELSITKTGFQPQTKRLYSRVASDRVAVKLTSW